MGMINTKEPTASLCSLERVVRHRAYRTALDGPKGRVCRHKGGVNCGCSGVRNGSGGVIRGSGGVIRGSGGVICRSGKVIRRSGEVIRRSGGVRNDAAPPGKRASGA